MAFRSTMRTDLFRTRRIAAPSRIREIAKVHCMYVPELSRTSSPVLQIAEPTMSLFSFRIFGASALCLLLVATYSSAAEDASPRERRLLVDHDGHALFSTLTTDYKADIDELVGELPPNVTTFLLCCGAGRYYFPTKVSDVDPRLRQLNQEHAAGHDPFGYFLQQLKASGKETFITFRMNDTHNPTDADHWNTPRVRLEHPDVVVDAEAIARNSTDWMNWALDYSRPEVQTYIRAMLQEVVERYANTIHGLQLDWMRFPRHLSGHGDDVWAKRHFLTQIVEEARKLTRARGLTLAVRVPPTPAGCRVLGADVEAWAQRDLVDFITVSEFLDTDYEMPVGEFRRLVGPRLPIYTSIETEIGWQTNSPESLRAVATSLYASGADGLSFFNFPRTPFTATPWEWLPGLESADTAARKPLLFAVPQRKFRKNVDQPGLLPATIPARSTLSLPLPLPPLALPAQRARVLLSAAQPLAASVNGQDIAAVPTLRWTELFVEYIRPGEARRPKQADARLYRVKPDLLHAGENVLELRNESDAPVEVIRVNLGLW
jgi:hypothetical protein